MLCILHSQSENSDCLDPIRVECPIERPQGGAMETQDGLKGSIGRTPLIHLRGPSTVTGREILGKAEFPKRCRSVTDRDLAIPIRDTGERAPQSTPIEAVDEVANSGRARRRWVHG
jgi:hypothetical protein